jgi:hypothetical protein
MHEFLPGLPYGIHVCIPKIPIWLFFEGVGMENFSLLVNLYMHCKGKFCGRLV